MVTSPRASLAAARRHAKQLQEAQTVALRDQVGPIEHRLGDMGEQLDLGDARVSSWKLVHSGTETLALASNSSTHCW
jgi:hypothetical protein